MANQDIVFRFRSKEYTQNIWPIFVRL